MDQLLAGQGSLSGVKAVVQRRRDEIFSRTPRKSRCGIIFRPLLLARKQSGEDFGLRDLNKILARRKTRPRHCDAVRFYILPRVSRKLDSPAVGRPIWERADLRKGGGGIGVRCSRFGLRASRQQLSERLKWANQFPPRVRLSGAEFKRPPSGPYQLGRSGKPPRRFGAAPLRLPARTATMSPFWAPK
ncbi:hypothetical protein MRX96_045290 [Rhipicephalus microplus]